MPIILFCNKKQKLIIVDNKKFYRKNLEWQKPTVVDDKMWQDK
jgi:hypothetical protein